MRTRTRWCGAMCAALLSASAQATVLNLYNDPAAWQSATTSFSLIDFSGLATSVGSVRSYSTSAGLAVGGVQFLGYRTGTIYDLAVVNPAATWGSNFNSGSVLRGPGYSADAYEQSIVVNLPAGITAFALDLMSMDPGALSFKIVLSTGEVYTGIATQPRPTRTTFGLTADAAISQISLILESGDPTIPSYPLIDNFMYGVAYIAPPPPPPAAVAEASSLLYVGTGALMLLLSRRLRRLHLTR